jgi:hypothetical protein
MQNIDLLHPQHPKSRTSMAFSTAMLPASPSICAPTSHTCRQMVTSNSYATWASTTLHPLMCPRSMHWAIVALQACWRSVCSTTFPHPCLIYQVTYRPSVNSHQNPKGEDPGGEVTSSFAATSPTLLAAAKCVWMMRKAGLPMPLPAANARFPVPVIRIPKNPEGLPLHRPAGVGTKAPGLRVSAGPGLSCPLHSLVVRGAILHGCQ